MPLGTQADEQTAPGSMVLGADKKEVVDRFIYLTVRAIWGINLMDFMERLVQRDRTQSESSKEGLKET
jgi:hypothetical protein